MNIPIKSCEQTYKDLIDTAYSLSYCFLSVKIIGFIVF